MPLGRLSQDSCCEEEKVVMLRIAKNLPENILSSCISRQLKPPVRTVSNFKPETAFFVVFALKFNAECQKRHTGTKLL
jgi:hypothetical protein